MASLLVRAKISSANIDNTTLSSLLSNQKITDAKSIDNKLNKNKEDGIMTHIDYFKLQAKNLLRDYKTQFLGESEDYEYPVYSYRPRFFDIEDIISIFNIDENSEFTLMNAQHIVAKFAGFKKWTELIKASETALELGKLFFDNREQYQEKVGIFTDIVPSVIVQEWEWYLRNLLRENNLTDIDDESKLEIFKYVFLGIENENSGESAHLNTDDKENSNWSIEKINLAVKEA